MCLRVKLCLRGTIVPGLKLSSTTEGRCGFKEPCCPFKQAVAGVNNDSAKENKSNPPYAWHRNLTEHVRRYASPH